MEIFIDLLYLYFPVALDNPVHISRETVTILYNCKDFMACILNNSHRLSSLGDNGKNLEIFTLFHVTVLKDEI